MILPSTLTNNTEWTFVGPMGPVVPETLLKHPLIAVDGGAHHSPRLDIWVGDADSYTEKVNCNHQYKHPVDKNQSDLALALSFFGENLLYKFHFWGFLGGRRDHEMFNLGEALTYLENHPESQIIFYGADGKISFHLLGAGDWKFQHTGLYSLGTLKKVTVKMTGECKYPIPRSTFVYPLSSLGLSNVGEGTIVLKVDGPIFIYYPEGK